MARYNTVITSATASSAAAFTSPGSGAFTKLTGSSYTVTIGDPVLFSGLSQTFYNAASGTVTLTFTTAGGGVFVGPGGSGTVNQSLSTGTTITCYSDGTNWVTLGAGAGGPLIATSGSFSSDVSLTGTTPTINFNNSNPTIATNNASSTANIFTTNVTTLNIGNAASTIALGVNAGTTTLKGTLSFAGSSSGTVKFIAPATAGTQSYTLPSAAPGTDGYALVSTTGGTMSWAPAGATVSDDSSTATLYPTFFTATSGAATALKVSSGKMTFNASSGLLTVTSLTESSSRALKMNINPIDNALDAVLQLKGVTYDRKDGTSQNEAGLIAEQVNKILPNLVTKDAKGKPTGIHYTKLTAYLIEAVKSLQLEINDLSKQLKKTQKGGK
jgi:hypothetical protein